MDEGSRGLAATGLVPRQVAAQSGAAARPTTPGPPSPRIRPPSRLTTHGKVRGFVHEEMFIFKGLPYGAPTTGPALHGTCPAGALERCRSALAWGFACPQIPPEHWDKDEAAFVYEWNLGAQGAGLPAFERLGRLASTTASAPSWSGCTEAASSVGSGNEMNVYDGENLARHDVVVVSLNHRLGALGFLDLSSLGGERFAASGKRGTASTSSRHCGYVRAAPRKLRWRPI